VHAGFLEFLNDGISNSKVWETVKTNLTPVFYHVILPAIWFGQHNAATWQEDPVEYINRKYTTADDGWNPRQSASELLCNICRESSRALGSILGYCEKSMASYEAADLVTLSTIHYTLYTIHYILDTRH
jgi:hypothetical protein